MKKSIMLSAMAIAFLALPLHAETLSFNAEASAASYERSDTPVINPFCLSIVKGDFETVKKLIDLGADVNQKSNGMTPAMFAAKYNRVKILKLLISKGANLKAKSDKGMRAAQYATLSNAQDTKALIEETLRKS